jgi:hypothetical protein
MYISLEHLIVQFYEEEPLTHLTLAASSSGVVAGCRYPTLATPSSKFNIGCGWAVAWCVVWVDGCGRGVWGGVGWGEAGVVREREREGERERERERKEERKREREGGREREREREGQNIVSYRGERPRQSFVDIICFRSVHLDSCSVSPPAALSISPLLSMWICIAHVLSCTVNQTFVWSRPDEGPQNPDGRSQTWTPHSAHYQE